MDLETTYVTVVGVLAIVIVVVMIAKHVISMLLDEYEKDLIQAVNEASTPEELAIARNDYDRFQSVVHPEKATRRPW